MRRVLYVGLLILFFVLVMRFAMNEGVNEVVETYPNVSIERGRTIMPFEFKVIKDFPFPIDNEYMRIEISPNIAEAGIYYFKEQDVLNTPLLKLVISDNRRLLPEHGDMYVVDGMKFYYYEYRGETQNISWLDGEIVYAIIYFHNNIEEKLSIDDFTLMLRSMYE